MANISRRILVETRNLSREPPPGISATPDENNCRYFHVIMAGPNGSPYEDKLGRICLDILKDQWSPALQIRTVLLSIQALLGSPNPDDPLANDVANMWKNNETEAILKAKEWTQIYAIGE
ncbi:hypothetical protein Trydic_g22996 [Trypoxylus dichotomus]